MIADEILKWTGVIMPFLLGGGIIAWLKFFKENRNEYRDYAASELLKVKEELVAIRANYRELQSVIIPTIVPEWRKSLDRKYEHVNQNYEFTILLPIGLTREDVIGKTDEEIFEDYPEFVTMMNDLDKEARKAVNRFVIRRGVLFPESHSTAMVIKEIVQSVAGKIFYVGRAYIEDTKQ